MRRIAPLMLTALGVLAAAPGTGAVPEADVAGQATDSTRMKPGLYQLKTNAVTASGAKNAGPTVMRLCLTQAMLEHGNPLPGQSGSCTVTKDIHASNRTHTEFSCIKDGKTTTGRRDETVDGNSRTSVLDLADSDKEGAHVIHLETEMTFLGPDCNAAYSVPTLPIKVRHYRYQVTMDADGRIEQLQSDYRCRLEGDTAAALTEYEWHYKGGLNQIRINGKFPDGSQFKVLPIHLDWRPWDKNAGQCPESTQSVESEIWLTQPGNPSRLERFDRHHDRSNRHHLRLLNSQFVLYKTDEAQPGDTEPQPVPYREDGPQYYQVLMVTVPAESVNDLKGLKEFTAQKRIPWMAKGETYPFAAWSDDAVAFARNYRGMFTTEDDIMGGPDKQAKGLQTRNAFPENNEWHIDSRDRNLASQWLLMPEKKDADKAFRADPAAISKTWVVYDGTRIEIPLFKFDRVFFDRTRNEYVLFSINRVDAD